MGVGLTQHHSCPREVPCCSAASFSWEREESGERSGEDRLCGKRQSASEGGQGSCPRSEDTKPRCVQPLHGRLPDMRHTPCPRQLCARDPCTSYIREATFEATRLEICSEICYFFLRRIAAGEIVHCRVAGFNSRSVEQVELLASASAALATLQMLTTVCPRLAVFVLLYSIDGLYT